MKSWVKLPTGWIDTGGLKSFRWKRGEGSANVAGLMLLAVIAHHADDEHGVVQITYDSFQAATGLSRAKISDGLSALVDRGLVERLAAQSAYRIVEFDPSRGWGKLPARGLYRHERIPAFHELRLRRVAELDALKLYYGVVARRDNDSNLARMNYETIEEYAGVPRNRIKSALSLLAVNNLVHVEHVPSWSNEYGVSNAYRLTHLETNRHMGNRGKHLLRDGDFSSE
ncbi:hypothetical protein HKX17_17745 [Sulfitobacter sp. KE34]|uniref:hypothetical protein n=1 Tax=unclassified Sulfitobacter TaxID=196795 RepID=UPI0023E31114|nr:MULTISPECIES: hypothetical protein [unclassified Sulfitobacter]MDF3351944.1 hypothetical protein [Sulfitobacter sp. KE12]MDF3355624.1 hypothetical protein [Sulfitobacter sp. KE27]MDF3359322.1 hypothetical protein [Sulfitobacter sp. KE33]MDF3366731.1 hypothetical protein [Sulfitobacter sp. Ks34]MDF3370299.1 hypothetical protein [Sulfitobacter sp. Ks43]